MFSIIVLFNLAELFFVQLLFLNCVMNFGIFWVCKRETKFNADSFWFCISCINEVKFLVTEIMSNKALISGQVFGFLELTVQYISAEFSRNYSFFTCKIKSKRWLSIAISYAHLTEFENILRKIDSVIFMNYWNISDSL